MASWITKLHRQLKFSTGLKRMRRGQSQHAASGATENARNEISAPSKMQVMKIRDMKIRHHNAWHENTRHENTGKENTRHENARQENARNENSGKV